MARGKGGAKAHGQERPNTLTEKERQICPLCIEPLDPTEKRFFPCPCGYQVCLFCFRRLKEEFSNQCPGCRTVYGSDFDPGRRARNEVKQERLGHAADLDGVPPPGSLQRPLSPAAPVSSQQQQQQKHLEAASDRDSSIPELLPVRAASPLAPIAIRQSAEQAEGSGQQQPVPSQHPPSALLQLSQGAPVTPDPDGAALLASTQQRVASGGLSVQEAARLLVSFLRAKQASAGPNPQSGTFYANGSLGLAIPGPVSRRSPPLPDLSFGGNFSAQRSPSTGLQGAPDGGLLSSLLGEPTPQGPPSWPQQQPRPDDDLMRLLWGTHTEQQGLLQPSWAHAGPANVMADPQMDGHVPLYARTRNGMHPDAAARGLQADKANGMHGQNGFTSHGSWLSSSSITPELAAIAMSAPPK